MLPVRAHQPHQTNSTDTGSPPGRPPPNGRSPTYPPSRAPTRMSLPRLLLLDLDLPSSSPRPCSGPSSSRLQPTRTSRLGWPAKWHRRCHSSYTYRPPADQHPGRALSSSKSCNASQVPLPRTLNPVGGAKATIRRCVLISAEACMLARLILMFHSATLGPRVGGVRPCLLPDTRQFPAAAGGFVMRQQKYHFSATNRKERHSSKTKRNQTTTNQQPSFSAG